MGIKKIGSNKWEVDAHIKKGGKEYRKREIILGTKTQANSRLDDLKQELRMGVKISSSKTLITFGDVLEKFREHRESLGNSVDEIRYRRLFRDLGDVPLPQVPDRLEAYIRQLRLIPSTRTKKPNSNPTINRYMSLCNAAFNLMVNMDLLDRNPLSKARFPKLKEIPRDRVLNDLETSRFLEVIGKEAPHILPITKYALQVPCRISEMVNMKREDLDLSRNCIRVRNGTTKNDQGCDKPIPPDMLEYFRTLPSEAEYLFYRMIKGSYAPLGYFRKSWKKCLQIAGIKDFRVHDTRHNAGTALLDNGTPEQVVLTVGGWKTNMLRTYYHREGKKALSLVRFSPESGHPLDTSSPKAT